MTLTTDVRINYPLDAPALFDHMTRFVGGDPATVIRHSHKPGDDYYGTPQTTYRIGNQAGQGLHSLLWIEWGEGDIKQYDDCPPAPPACVVFTCDNPYGTVSDSGRDWQANRILPALRDYLDVLGVPRTAWFWEDETAGTWHPGTEPVEKLASSEPRETWAA